MKVDMSPEAVTARLRLASQLRRLCLSLGKALPVNRPIEAPAVADAPTVYGRQPHPMDELPKPDRAAEPKLKE